MLESKKKSIDRFFWRRNDEERLGLASIFRYRFTTQIHQRHCGGFAIGKAVPTALKRLSVAEGDSQSKLFIHCKPYPSNVVGG